MRRSLREGGGKARRVNARFSCICAARGRRGGGGDVSLRLERPRRGNAKVEKRDDCSELSVDSPWMRPSCVTGASRRVRSKFKHRSNILEVSFWRCEGVFRALAASGAGARGAKGTLRRAALLGAPRGGAYRFFLMSLAKPATVAVFFPSPKARTQIYEEHTRRVMPNGSRRARPRAARTTTSRRRRTRAAS